MLIAFLAIAKSEVPYHKDDSTHAIVVLADRKHSNSAAFRQFRRQLFHTSLTRIFSSLRPGMTEPEVVLCADSKYRRAIYGFGPYIADYPEQVLIACVVQNWCAR